jgi:hypothetical protein
MFDPHTRSDFRLLARALDGDCYLTSGGWTRATSARQPVEAGLAGGRRGRESAARVPDCARS